MTNIIFNRKSVKEQNELYDKVVSELRSKIRKNVLKLADMSMPEQHSVLSMVNLAEYAATDGGLKKNTDWTKITPEYYSFFKNKNIKNLYVCDYNLVITRKNYTLSYNPINNLSEKAIEQYFFYKIGIPAKTGNSFCMERLEDKGTINSDVYYYGNKLANKFFFFCKANK